MSSITTSGLGFSLFPYQYLSSRVIAAAATSAANSTHTSLQPPTFFGSIIVQFTKQIMRPKIVLPMLLVAVILFDLDESLDLDDFDWEDDEWTREDQEEDQ